MTGTQGARPILVVEDSDDDYETTFRGLTRAGVLNMDIRRCEDGQEALDYLFRRGVYRDKELSPRPGFILLDLNLPGKDGRAVAREVKSDPSLSKIPLIILTTSDDERDIEECYALGANSYVRKPVKLESFFDALERIKDYWFEVVILPKGQDGDDSD
jgi:two-component system response regulator